MWKVEYNLNRLVIKGLEIVYKVVQYIFFCVFVFGGLIDVIENFVLVGF